MVDQSDWFAWNDDITITDYNSKWYIQSKKQQQQQQTQQTIPCLILEIRNTDNNQVGGPVTKT